MVVVIVSGGPTRWRRYAAVIEAEDTPVLSDDRRSEVLGAVTSWSNAA